MLCFSSNVIIIAEKFVPLQPLTHAESTSQEVGTAGGGSTTF